MKLEENTLLKNMIDDLSKLVSIPSVWQASDDKNSPFGKPCKDALNLALNLAKTYGFATVNKDSYGYVEYGNGKTCVGALCHLDVVPTGSGWDSDPFILTIKDGHMYGRGVTDDKGAFVAVLYALKRIKDNNLQLKRRIRIIIGTNEERGSLCIKNYVQNEEIPICSFVPDAEFPIINSEKGILHFTLETTIDNIYEDFVAISGGNVLNTVPDFSQAIIKYNSPLFQKISKLALTIDNNLLSLPIFANLAFDKNDLNIMLDKDKNIIITATGVSAHAMEPHKGSNAIIKLLTFLSVVCDMPKYKAFGVLGNLLDSDKLALSNLNIDCEKSGNLTLNLAKIEINQKGIKVSIDTRLPLIVDEKEFQNKLQNALKKYNIFSTTTYTMIMYKPNLFIDMNNPLITTLLKIYTKHTGHQGYGLKIGGGTYARELSNAVAFGPHFPNRIVDIHKPNEKYNLDDFIKIVDIYYDAFVELCNQ